MMTQQLKVSILAAPLAAIDRRTLSQAWYSALRLAREEQSPARVNGCKLDAAFVREPAPRRDEMTVERLRGAATRSPRVAKPTTTVTSGEEEPRKAVARRSLRSPLAQRIERAFSDRRPQLKRATFSIEHGGARVHLILQTRGSSAALVALCRPELRNVVARALAQARFALAARGIGLEVETKGVRRCS